jgi:ABC-type phosphate transport system auxiliary subunit
MTPYSTIFKVFLNKISDPIYANLDIEVAEDDMIMLLNEAVLLFEYPKIDLKDKNDEDQVFNNTLGFDEIQLLAHLMTHAWLQRQLRDIELLRQTMSPLEFQKYSQANHINSLLKLEQHSYEYIETLKKRYSRRDNNKSLLHKLGGE